MSAVGPSAARGNPAPREPARPPNGPTRPQGWEDHKSARHEARAWVAQRASAAVLALCVVAHLATMIYAVRHGLTADAILGRTRGNAAWAAFYGVFVTALAVHAPLGLRSVAAEWLGWRGRGANLAWIVVGFALLALGARAIAAVAL